MNYGKVYCELIDRARNRVLAEYTERHHIIPKSLGGQETYENLVELTIREHFIAHCLLYKMGLTNQIFSVECFLIDSLNHTHRRYKKIKSKNWIRRHLTIERAKQRREFNRLNAERRQV